MATATATDRRRLRDALEVGGAGIRPASATRTPEEIDVERRLLYVAMTRAKGELDLVVPQRFYSHQQAKFGDGHVYATVSRFIPASIRDLFDAQSWGERAAGGRIKAAKKSGPMTDVAASLLRMWR
jgi:DNA helicase-2/ATP-dependent DNA helicase PcrA